MKENGSPRPEFETDDDRSYFLIRLPAHPKAESDESARSGTREKTSGKILTEIHNNRNVTIAALSERIRDIRSAEKVFRRNVQDIYATSIDYFETAFDGA